MDNDSPARTCAAVGTAAADWHHPHFISVTRIGLDRPEFEFRPFTGDEPEPALPADVAALRDSSTSRAVWYAAADEVQAARLRWRIARYRRDATARLRAAEPAWKEYRRTTRAAAAAYAALDETPDGRWRIALLALVDTRTAAMDAARALDDAAYPIAELDAPVGPWWGVSPDDRAPTIYEVARDAGIDTVGWEFVLDRSPDRYEGLFQPSPTQRRLQGLFDTQDERIRKVARLAGEPE